VGHRGCLGLVRVVVGAVGTLAGSRWLAEAPLLVGVLLCLLMPAKDRMAMRYVVIGCGAGSGAWLAWLVRTDAWLPVVLAVAVGFVVAVRAGAPRVAANHTRVFGVSSLLWLVVQVAVVAASDDHTRRMAMMLGTFPWLAWLGVAGGAQRGSVALRAGGFLLSCDVVGAYAALHAASHPGWVFLSWLPALARLVLGPFGMWHLAVLDEAPVGAAAFAWLSLPSALWVLDGWFHHQPIWMPLLPALVMLVAPTSTLLSVAERDARRLVAHAVSTVTPFCVLAMAYGQGLGRAAAILGVCSATLGAVVAMAILEALERRTETRDLSQLAGIGRREPLLVLSWLTTLTAILAPCGAGGLALIGLLDTNAKAAGGSFGWVPVGLALLCCGGTLAGAVIAARRCWWPSPKTAHSSEGMSLLQSVRVVAPVLALLLFIVGAYMSVGGLGWR
jgi:hypothetical protein